MSISPSHFCRISESARDILSGLVDQTNAFLNYLPNSLSYFDPECQTVWCWYLCDTKIFHAEKCLGPRSQCFDMVCLKAFSYFTLCVEIPWTVQHYMMKHLGLFNTACQNAFGLIVLGKMSCNCGWNGTLSRRLFNVQSQSALAVQHSAQWGTPGH